MKLTIALDTLWTCGKEVLRALSVPPRVVLSLPGNRAWRALTRDALQSDADAVTERDALGAFLRGRRLPDGRPGHVFVSAGEPSGEAHACRLMDAVREAGHAPRWSCFGGAGMAERGGELLYPLSEHAVMGFAGVARSLPFVVRAYARFAALLRSSPPDLVVLCDYPGLHLVMAAAAQRYGIPVVHYIAPQFWGWAPWRVRRYRRCVDATLTILPFEPRFFARAGVFSEYVGHPLLDQLNEAPPDAAATTAVRAHGTLCLMPGSRRKELLLHVPGMVRVARALREDDPELRVVMPQRDASKKALIDELLRREDAKFVEPVVGDPGPYLAGARAALCKSGTGSLESCLYDCPTVVVYVLRSRLGQLLRHWVVNAPFFAVANLIANRAVVPEIVVERDRHWDVAARQLRTLWRDGPERQACLDGLALVRARLGTPGASRRASRWVLPFCGGRSA